LGLLMTSRDRSRIYYMANKQSPLHSALKSLVAHSADLFSLLQESLALSDVEFVFIPGEESASLNDRSRKLPVVIVQQQDLRDLRKLVHDAGAAVGRELEAEYTTLYQVRAGLASGDKRIAALLKTKKTFIVGRELHFMESVNQGSAGTSP
jgi:hypothetical protein